jgi:signal transduction histidine kinase/CheY-like chemotaxis protein
MRGSTSATSAPTPGGPCLLAAFSLLLTGFALRAQTSNVQAGEGGILTSAREAHSLTAEEAGRALPVRLQAVVTYYDPYIDSRHGALFVCDSSGCIFVSIPVRPILPIRAGTKVEVQGVSGPGDFAPIVDGGRIRAIGESRVPPTASRVGLGRLLTGAEDGQWVEVDGLVHSVRESGKNVVLELGMNDGAVTATTVKQDGVDYARLVDARVRIHGNAAPLYNGNRQMAGVRLFFPTIREVTIEEVGPADPFALPVHPINSLLRFASNISVFHRVHVSGRVTLHWPGRSLCIQDGTQGLCVRTSQASQLSEGDLVDVAGFPSVGDYSPTLTDATFRRVGTGQPVSATPVPAERALRGDHDAAVIQIDGKLIGQDLSADDPTLVFSAANLVFPAILPKSASGSGIPWTEGSKVRLTGICSVQVDSQSTNLREGAARPKSFRILLRSPRDVVVLEPPSWWTARHALLVLALVFAITLCVLWWVVALRGRLKQQTEVIGRQLEETAALKEAAVAASRAKSQFLANMSHEIRTPLHGILGMADLAMEVPPGQDQQHYLKLVKQCGTSLLTVINDILDLSKIEAGHLQLDVSSFRLRESLGTTMAMLSVRAQQKGLEFSVLVEPEVPDAVIGDAGRLNQVLVNLAANAVKFTQAGSVAIRVGCEAVKETSAVLRIAVEDTGIGIEPGKTDLIFEAFEQADSSVTRKFGGTGLGLAISRRLVTMMGGRIWVESKPGQGSTFQFTAELALDRAAAPAGELPDAPRTTPAEWHPPLRVLLAEDNSVNQLLATRLLQKQGHEVVAVSNGQEALERIARENYDVVLMDVQMPIMDGLMATRQIREREKASGSHVPIVALTARAMDDDKGICIAAGMDAYLSKPLQTDQLVRLLNAIASRGRGSGCQPGGSWTETASGHIPVL